MYSLLSFFPFRPVGSFEVGVYDYNPPSLLLRGDSTGNGTPAVLKYVNWPGKSYQLLWRLMSPKKKTVGLSVLQRWTAEKRN